MSYRRFVEPSRLSPPCSLAVIDSVQLLNSDGVVKSSPIDLSQVDKIHVEDLAISVLKENGQLGNFKPYYSDPNLINLNDSIKSANAFIKKASDFKESIVESENIDNNESN